MLFIAYTILTHDIAWNIFLWKVYSKSSDFAWSFFEYLIFDIKVQSYFLK